MFIFTTTVNVAFILSQTTKGYSATRGADAPVILMFHNLSLCGLYNLPDLNALLRTKQIFQVRRL